MLARVGSIWPGLAVAVVIAACGRLTGFASNGLAPEATVAVLVGLAVRSKIELPGRFKPGVQYALTTVLRIAIALLGAQLSLQLVIEIGGATLLILVVTMSLALGIALFGAKVLGLSPTLAVLLGVGTAICGNTAIITAGPIIGATEQELSYAVLAITLLGTVSVFLYPLIGVGLTMPQASFGVWSGVAVHDTSQVVATAASYGDGALRVATVVKLTRNVLMAPVMIILALRRGGRVDTARVTSAVPWFVVAFLALVALRTFGVIPAPVGELANTAARAMVLVALAGVGLATDLRSLARIGVRPLILAAVIAAAVSIVGLIGSSMVGPSIGPT